MSGYQLPKFLKDKDLNETATKFQLLTYNQHIKYIVFIFFCVNGIIYKWMPLFGILMYHSSQEGSYKTPTFI